MIINKAFFKEQIKEMRQVKKLLTEIENRHPLELTQKWAIAKAKQITEVQIETARRTIK